MSLSQIIEDAFENRAQFSPQTTPTAVRQAVD